MAPMVPSLVTATRRALRRRLRSWQFRGADGLCVPDGRLSRQRSSCPAIGGVRLTSTAIVLRCCHRHSSDNPIVQHNRALRHGIPTHQSVWVISDVVNPCFVSGTNDRVSLDGEGPLVLGAAHLEWHHRAAVLAPLHALGRSRRLARCQQTARSDSRTVRHRAVQLARSAYRRTSTPLTGSRRRGRLVG
ncbi:hypothetical protein HNR05_001399 [Leifsonia psychrotolerans]|uniref:Uncharacterized protein n=1 Tax=Glaciibacter psychrotolerans TaxID=670054 RepID=A0A7Z0EDH2_9MICO|nr:hypothetical protein [Leifsonia psychrotolerans]